MTDIDELVKKVVEESGKTKKEITARMEERKEKTHGLLSDYGAIYAVAKELGISLDDSEKKVELIKVTDIKPQKSLNVVGRVKSVYMPREFKRKDGTTGKFASLVLVDNTGDIRLVLWDNNTEIVNKITKNDLILVRNAYAKEGMNGIEVHAGSLSNIAINPNFDAEISEVEEDITKIDDVEQGMPSINLICRVLMYYPTTEFTRKDGSVGYRASFIAQDESGKIRVVLWDSNAKTSLKQGDIVKIENGYAKQGLNGEIEIHAGNRSRVLLSEEKMDLPPMEEVKEKEFKIKDVQANESGFSIVLRVLRVYPPREYSNGQMASIMAGDDTGMIRVVFWNEQSEHAAKLKRSDTIRIKNAYSKANLSNVPEVHVGKYGQVNVDRNIKLPSLDEIEKGSIAEKEIADLASDDQFVKINGKIVEIDESRPILFMTCPTCGKRVQNIGTEWFCEPCDDVVEPKPNLVLSLILEDTSGNIRVVTFRNKAEKLLSMDIEEVMNLIGEMQDEFAPVKKSKKELLNKKASFFGRVRYNSFSDQLEFIADDVSLG